MARRFKALVISACAITGTATIPATVSALQPPVDEATSVAVTQHASVLIRRATNAAAAASSPSAEEVQRIEAIALALFAENEMAALAPRVDWLIAARPQSWRARWLESHLSFLRGHGDQALSSASLCLELSPGYGPCHFVRGAVTQGSSPGSTNALNDLRAANRWNPRDVTYAEAYARALLSSGEARQALDLLEPLVMAGNPREMIPTALLAARAAEEAGDLVAAESWFAVTMDNHPDPAAGIRYLVQFYERQGRAGDAAALMTDFRRRQGPASQDRQMRPLR